MLYAVFFLSGVCGLGYQMVWTRMFAIGLGHEMPSVLAVVAAFFGGLAFGSWLLDGTVSRSPRPGHWYVGLEVIIGSWACVSVVLVPWLNGAALELTGIEPTPLWHWTVAFAVPFVALLPATTAMGATLPAMERFVSPLAADGRVVGGLYGANTAGAVTGTLAGAFLLVPWLGFSATIVLLAALNFVCAVAAWAIAARRPTPLRRAESVYVAPTDLSARWRIGSTVFVTGLLGIGYEVLAVRAMAQVLANTVYSFALALSVYLLCTAFGAALYQRYGRRATFAPVLSYLLCALSAACMGGVVALSFIEPVYYGSRRLLNNHLLAEGVVAASVFALPTLLMGATFSHLVQASRRKEGGVGQAAALNTFGGSLAPVLFGVALLPAVGVRWALVVVGLGYLLLIPRLTGRTALAAAVPVLLMLAGPSHLRLLNLPPGGKALDYRDGVMATVAVVEDRHGHRFLRVNNRLQMGSTTQRDTVDERRQGLLPLLLHPSPKRALFLGIATGITFGAAADHPELWADGVELVPEVLEVLPYFEPYNAAPAQQPRLHLYVADARRFVQAAEARYDVIVADLFHPARDGAGTLYTVEHFRAVRGRLKPGGMFCQWLPLHQLDHDMLRVIVRTFLRVFPPTRAYLVSFDINMPALGLVATLEPVHYPPDWFARRVTDGALLEQLEALSLGGDVQLFGCLIAGPSQLRDYAGQGSLNTDNFPLVTFGAPRYTYRGYPNRYGRMLDLIDRYPADTTELIDLQSDTAAQPFVARLEQFIEARNVFLHGLVAYSRGERKKAIDAFVESARLSPDFTWGYAQCLLIASEQSKEDPRAARHLLERLIEAQPQRPNAHKLLNHLQEQ